MRPRSVARKRCTECRRWFRPATSAVETQRACSAGCRKHRRRRLARSRRRRDVQDYRVEERERQRECRQRRREAAGPSAAAACHAPPSARKAVDVLEKLLESWDTAMALSRATLSRKLPAVLRGLVPAAGTAEAGAGALSRATLGA
jgi:hypothetical protein